MNWIDQIETRLAALEAATGIAKDVPQPELTLENVAVQAHTYEDTLAVLTVWKEAGYKIFVTDDTPEFTAETLGFNASFWFFDDRGFINGHGAHKIVKGRATISLADFIAKFGPKQPETVTINVDGKDYVCRPMAEGENVEFTDIFKEGYDIHFARVNGKLRNTLEARHYYRPLTQPEPKAEVDTKEKLLADMYYLLEMFCFSQSHPVGNAQRLNLIGRYNRLTAK